MAFAREAMRQHCGFPSTKFCCVFCEFLPFYQAGRFPQFNEGSECNLRMVMRRIELDPRHRKIQYLFDEPVPERGLAQWSMEAFNLGKSESLKSDLLVVIRDSYRANFATCTNTVVNLYKGFIEQRLLS